MQVFTVNKIADWQPVAIYLLQTAAGSPLSEEDSKFHTTSEEVVWRKVSDVIKTGRAETYSAMVLYTKGKSDVAISLIMTVEPHEDGPSAIHLSMVRLIPVVANVRLERLNDVLALEIAEQILHVYEERREGVPEVRNFYREFS